MSEISNDKLKVKVLINPLSIFIYRNNEEVIYRASREFDINGKKRRMYPASIKESDNSIIVESPEAKLYIKLSGETIEISWKSDKPVNFLDYWVSRTNTSWYGQGQLFFQRFPLNTHAISNEPFLANNIQAPLWITRNGVAILVDNYKLFNARFRNGVEIESIKTKKFTYHVIVSDNIIKARKIVLKKIGFPKRAPSEEIIKKPVFSTWVMYKKSVDQDKVLDLVEKVSHYKFPCSVIELDDKWEKNYGDFEFDRDKFPNPREMVRRVHEAGYLATLWVYPFINYESKNYEVAKKNGYLVMDPVNEEPAKVRWWDGEGGLIDISNPEARKWFNGMLNNLKKNYGFDGFKFDAGDGYFFPLILGREIRLGKTYGNLTPNKYTDEWLRFIFDNQYNLAEARVGYLAQSFGVIAREGDKESAWGIDNGLYASLTQALTLSITGYPYIMPDMIGGNEYRFKCDKELFIRWAEAASLMPIIQYSIPPWRYDDEAVEISRKYSLLHLRLGDYYMKLVRLTLEGEPIISPLVLKYPEDNSATVNDEFLLGDILVAPVLDKGKNKREVYLPRGKWIDFWDDRELTGNSYLTVNAPLEILPIFINSNNPELVKLLKDIRAKVFRI